MLVDLTLKISPKMVKDAQGNERQALVGHLGTHFDVMNKEFPLEYTKRKGLVFDVRHVEGRDVEIGDIDMSRLEKDMFVMFCTGYISKVEYGTPKYYSEHPQLSFELMEELLKAGVSMIGVDCSGVRRGAEHIPADQHCADQNVFVIENIWNLETICEAGGNCVVNTYPMNYAEMTGLPCRIVAEL